MLGLVEMEPVTQDAVQAPIICFAQFLWLDSFSYADHFTKCAWRFLCTNGICVVMQPRHGFILCDTVTWKRHVYMYGRQNFYLTWLIKYTKSPRFLVRTQETYNDKIYLTIRNSFLMTISFLSLQPFIFLSY